MRRGNGQRKGERPLLYLRRVHSVKKVTGTVLRGSIKEPSTERMHFQTSGFSAAPLELLLNRREHTYEHLCNSRA
jgi:hypothetical protein